MPDKARIFNICLGHLQKITTNKTSMLLQVHLTYREEETFTRFSRYHHIYRSRRCIFKTLISITGIILLVITSNTNKLHYLNSNRAGKVFKTLTIIKKTIQMFLVQTKVCLILLMFRFLLAVCSNLTQNLLENWSKRSKMQ